MNAKDKTVIRPKIWPVIFFIIVYSLITQGTANGQAVVNLSPVAKQQFFSVSGAPLASGCISTFQTGTSTPQATYVDGTGATPNPNPIILDAGGFANIWLTNVSYRFVVVAYDGIPGNKCAAGVTQYTIDAINAFQPINIASNLLLSGNTSDPAGTAGEMTYRSDIPCFRFFTTFWDCVVRLTDTQTLTNKTLTSPTITGPTVTNGTFATPSLSSPSVAINTPSTITYQNSPVSTTLNLLAMLDLGNAGTVKTWCSSGCGNPANAGAIGICVSNCSNSGNAQIAVSGVASCAFDNATTYGDYVGISQSATGKCTDLGTLYPTAAQGQLVGRALSTNGVAGTYQVAVMLQPEVKGLSASIAQANLTAQSANISSTPMFTPTANGFYRFSCYLVVTTAATSSSTLPACNVLWTDADSSTSETYAATLTNTANTVGALGIQNAVYGGAAIYAKSGVSISYSTSAYATSGATSMVYAIHVRLEGPL